MKTAMRLIPLLVIGTVSLFAQNSVERQIYCADAGSTDAYSCTPSVAISSYITGRQFYTFKANTANTGAATITFFGGGGVKTIKKVAGGVTTDLDTNDIRVGQIVVLKYDGTNMQMVSALGNAGSGGGTWGTITGTLSSQTDLQAALDAKCALAGCTMTGALAVVSESYDATGWNGDTGAPQKDALRDQIETMLTSIAAKLTTTSLIPTSPNISITIGNTGTATPTLDVSTVYLNGLYGQLAAENTFTDKQIFTQQGVQAALRIPCDTLPSEVVGGNFLMDSSCRLGINDGTDANVVAVFGGSGAAYTLPAAGILRVAGSTNKVTSAELSGDVTTSGSNVATVISASTTVAGKAEAAIDTEVTAGTDAARYVTPDALAGSTIFGVKTAEIELFPAGTAASTGDGKAYFYIPASLNGMNLVGVVLQLYAAGTTGTINVDIARCATVATGNVCSGTVVDVLSTNLTVDSNEDDSGTAATAAVIDTSQDDVATGQVYRFDVDAIHTTPSQGAMLILTFQLP